MGIKNWINVLFLTFTWNVWWCCGFIFVVVPPWREATITFVPVFGHLVAYTQVPTPVYKWRKQVEGLVLASGRGIQLDHLETRIYDLKEYNGRNPCESLAPPNWSGHSRFLWSAKNCKHQLASCIRLTCRFPDREDSTMHNLITLQESSVNLLVVVVTTYQYIKYAAITTSCNWQLPVVWIQSSPSCVLSW